VPVRGKRTRIIVLNFLWPSLTSRFYRERGGLSKNVVIIGMMDHFEIWDDDRWSIYQREQAGPLDDLRERLAQKGV